jgi:class 3 adenylate cyclase
VRRFGGFVAKYLGDGVLIYFGYPQAHEGDAERLYALGWSWSRRWLRSRPLCLYNPVSALRLGWLSSAKVAGSEAENVIKIRKGGQVRCNLVGSPI